MGVPVRECVHACMCVHVHAHGCSHIYMCMCVCVYVSEDSVLCFRTYVQCFSASRRRNSRGTVLVTCQPC